MADEEKISMSTSHFQYQLKVDTFSIFRPGIDKAAPHPEIHGA
jgi:hypothetical protein